jgi:diaminopimelate decarboxylase
MQPLIWSRNVSRDEDGVIRVAGVRVDTLSARFGTPMFVFDEADFSARCAEFSAAFGDTDVYYAGKAFLSRAIVRLVAAAGLRLDVCSGGELATALAAGMPPGRIGLHGNNKSEAELSAALDAGVGRIVVDSFTEIGRLTSLVRARIGIGARAGAGTGAARPKILLRVSAGIEAHTHSYISTGHEDQKFGFSLAAGDAMEAISRVLSAECLELTGLHSHIGSQIFETTGFELAAQRLVDAYRQVRDRYGVLFPELNLGGGFGIAYTGADDPASADLLALGLKKTVEAECLAAGLPVPRLAIEPGRALVGPAMFTLYAVGTVKDTAARRYISVDGGMSDNIRTALYGAEYTAVLASRSSASPLVACRVVGKHCESGDIVVRDVELPADVGVGDLLAVPGTGAYCRSMASNYNHQPRPPVIAVSDGSARVIVRRETYEDLLALDVSG